MSNPSKLKLLALPPQIVIPFFSLLIKDIYFLNEGCASRLSNGHINFEVGLTRCVQWAPSVVVPHVM